MIVKFFDSGISNGYSPINYLLGGNRNRKGATVMIGDPDLTVKLINSTPFSKKYTSGVLSFTEDYIEDDLLLLIADDFEKIIFPGVSVAEYTFLWVKHEDKGRVELHFVIPTLNLLSGRRMQPYFVGQDFLGIEAWQSMINLKFNLDDPLDPSKANSLILGNRIKRSIKNIINIIIESNIDCEKYKIANKSESKIKNNSGCYIGPTRIKSIKIKANKSDFRLRAILAFNGFVCRYYFGEKALDSASAYYSNFSDIRRQQNYELIISHMANKKTYNKKRHPDYFYSLSLLENLKTRYFIKNSVLLVENFFDLEVNNVNSGKVGVEIDGLMYEARAAFEESRSLCDRLHIITSGFRKDIFECTDRFTGAIFRGSEAVTNLEESVRGFSDALSRYSELIERGYNNDISNL